MEFEDDHYKYKWDDCTFEIVIIDEMKNKIKSIYFLRHNDYCIGIMDEINFELNYESPVDFTFDLTSNNALYDAFKTFLGSMKFIQIKDDFRNNKKIDIIDNLNFISFHLTNNYTGDDDPANSVISIKNIMFDSRSNLFEDEANIKDRLFHLFEDVQIIFKAHKKDSYTLR